MKPGEQKQVQAALERFDNEAEVLGVTATAVRQGLQQDLRKSFEGAAAAKPLVQELYTDTNAVSNEARRRGHAVGAALTLGPAMTFAKPRTARQPSS